MDSTRSGKYPGARPLVTSQNADPYFHCGMLTWNTEVLHYCSVTVAWTSVSQIALACFIVNVLKAYCLLVLNIIDGMYKQIVKEKKCGGCDEESILLL